MWPGGHRGHFFWCTHAEGFYFGTHLCTCTCTPFTPAVSVTMNRKIVTTGCMEEEKPLAKWGECVHPHGRTPIYNFAGSAAWFLLVHSPVPVPGPVVGDPCSRALRCNVPFFLLEVLWDHVTCPSYMEIPICTTILKGIIHHPE